MSEKGAGSNMRARRGGGVGAAACSTAGTGLARAMPHALCSLCAPSLPSQQPHLGAVLASHKHLQGQEQGSNSAWP